MAESDIHNFRVLGKNHVRVDALDKVTGHATYAGDVYLPEMLMCKVLTSTRSHARIASIDTSEAEALPGVRGVITGKDFPDVFFGSGALQRPPRHGAGRGVLRRRAGGCRRRR